MIWNKRDLDSRSFQSSHETVALARTALARKNQHWQERTSTSKKEPALARKNQHWKHMIPAVSTPSVTVPRSCLSLHLGPFLSSRFYLFPFSFCPLSTLFLSSFHQLHRPITVCDHLFQWGNLTKVHSPCIGDASGWNDETCQGTDKKWRRHFIPCHRFSFKDANQDKRDPVEAEGSRPVFDLVSETVACTSCGLRIVLLSTAVTTSLNHSGHRVITIFAAHVSTGTLSPDRRKSMTRQGRSWGYSVPTVRVRSSKEAWCQLLNFTTFWSPSLLPTMLTKALPVILCWAVNLSSSVQGNERQN